METVFRILRSNGPLIVDLRLINTLNILLEISKFQIDSDFVFSRVFPKTKCLLSPDPSVWSLTKVSFVQLVVLIPKLAF